MQSAPQTPQVPIPQHVVTAQTNPTSTYQRQPSMQTTNSSEISSPPELSSPLTAPQSSKHSNAASRCQHTSGAPSDSLGKTLASVSKTVYLKML